MDQITRKSTVTNLAPRASQLAPRAFTLVELLVVITIIGILAALITVAAVGALKKGRQTEIKSEINQIDGGFNEVKNKFSAFPPNCQIDGSSGPINDQRVLADLKRFMRLAFPRHQEPDWVIGRLAGFDINPNDTTKINVAGPGKPMAGGMTAGEALVFWLGGFSTEDPKYPITGEGGPAYSIPKLGDQNNYKLDPIENRKWIFPCKVDRLVPRGSDGYFDSTSTRYCEFGRGPGNTAPFFRINFWQYTPRKLSQPYLYFDTSRYPPTYSSTECTDPPAATALAGSGFVGLSTTAGQPFNVYAFKKQNPAWSTSNSSVPALAFVNPDKFQIIHGGIDDGWDEDAFKRMSVQNVNSNLPSDYLLYPDGPFVGDMADTIVNFTTETKIEDVSK